MSQLILSPIVDSLASSMANMFDSFSRFIQPQMSVLSGEEEDALLADGEQHSLFDPSESIVVLRES